MNIEYRFDDRYTNDHEHIATVYDDNGEIVNLIVGKVNYGYTEEILMAECAERYGRMDETVRTLDELFPNTEEEITGERKASHIEQPADESQRQAEDTQAQNAASHYGGIAIRTTDTTALESAGCSYVEYEWVDMEDYGYSTSKSMEWVGKDGRVLTVICDNYYLVI